MSTKQNVLTEIRNLELMADVVGRRLGKRSPGRNALRRMRTAVNNGNVAKARQEMVAAISAFNHSEFKEDLNSNVRSLTYAFRLWAD